MGSINTHVDQHLMYTTQDKLQNPLLPTTISYPTISTFSLSHNYSFHNLKILRVISEQYLGLGNAFVKIFAIWSFVRQYQSRIFFIFVSASLIKWYLIVICFVILWCIGFFRHCNSWFIVTINYSRPTLFFLPILKRYGRKTNWAYYN